MALDAFLKLTGIKGESKDSKHAGEIELSSYSWGVTAQGAGHSGGGSGAGKPSFQDLSVTKAVDSATTGLLTHMVTGKHIEEGVLTLRKSGGGQQPYLWIKMNQMFVTSMQAGASSGGDDRPTEQVSFNYAKIEYKYGEQDKTGGVTGTSSSNYDLAANK